MAPPTFRWEKEEPTELGDYLLATITKGGERPELWHVRLAVVEGVPMWLRIPDYRNVDLTARKPVAWLPMPCFPYHMMKGPSIHYVRGARRAKS